MVASLPIRVAICTRHGLASEVVEVQERTLPAPGAGQVRIQMIAAPINPSDLLFCLGNYGVGPQPPTSVGLEGTGIVESAGPGWLGWLHKGKRVAVVTRTPGTWGTHCLSDAKTVVPVPDSLSDEQAASFFVNPASALLMTRWILNVPRDGWLLQSAAGSALGRMVIRLGTHFGFRTLNIVRRAEQAAELKQLGADGVIVADEQTPPQDFQEQVREACRGELPQHAIDPVGGPLGGMMLDVLGERGQMLSYASLAEAPIPVDPRTMLTNGLTLSGFWLGLAVETLSLPRKIAFIRELGKLHQQGIFQVETWTSFPLAEVKSAIAAAESHQGAAKVLIRLK